MRYFIDVRDSWSVSRKIIELPIKNEGYIQRNGIHIIHSQTSILDAKRIKEYDYAMLYVKE